MVALPLDFQARMRDMLQESYPAFLQSYEQTRHWALRVNTLKGTVSEFFQKTSFGGIRQVPWESTGFYYDNNSQPGKHPLHEAGVYYIQEPSAMAVVPYLEAKPQEKVLDLCAAPGGKTAQIASCMENKGLLLCNEIHPARAKILSENVERMGIQNALVTNESPQRLAAHFDSYFDRILVDAPCSGEGMFRKNMEACNEWSLEAVRQCANRQDEILDCAAKMLRPGGRLVYSTCTFAPMENEGSVARFLERHMDYQLVKVQKTDGMSQGVPAWAFYDRTDEACTSKDGDPTLEYTVRLFPHLVEGEGHYLAVLQKAQELPIEYQSFAVNGQQQGVEVCSVKEFLEFVKETFQIDLYQEQSERLLKFGDQLYWMPKEMPSIDQLKVLRPGLHLGTLKKNRFEPSHALALALCGADVKNRVELEEQEVKSYLSGMTFPYTGKKGWYLITYKGYSIGWGKLAGAVMKNHYPKGKRQFDKGSTV